LFRGIPPRYATTGHYRKRPALHFAGGGRAAQPGRCHGGEGRAPRGDAFRAAVVIPRPWCLCWMPGVGWWLVPGKPATLPPPTTARSRRESLRSPAAPLPPEENRAKATPTVQGRFWLPVQIFRRGFARVTFCPKTRKAASHLYPCNYPCKFRVISGHFRAFQRLSGHDRTEAVLFS